MLTKRLGVFMVILLLVSCQTTHKHYVCPPCNLDCDDLTFSGPGQCPNCRMTLIPKQMLATVAIRAGSGYFQMAGYREHPITIFYHKPPNYRPSSEIILVIPGSGRSAPEYRDAWIDASETFGWLIISPMYPERFYGFKDYHLAGLLDTSNLMAHVTMRADAHIAKLDETQVNFTINPRPEEWMFADFDRIFDLVKETLRATQNQYHLYGHSAGAHILHRLALFGESQKVGQILAANASFYTLPDTTVAFPFGLDGAPLDAKGLKRAFRKKFVLLLGELDNAQETKGTFLHSPTANQQGMHRLARGKYFFTAAEQAARNRQVPFHWQLKIIPGVGHDHAGMAEAAAKLLSPSED